MIRGFPPAWMANTSLIILLCKLPFQDIKQGLIISTLTFYKPEGRTMALGSTQPLTEMSTRNLPGGKGRSERKADNLTAICEAII
jgi:hypothetical protein